MAAPCYCRSHHKHKPMMESSSSTTDMDIDAALQELGMLSTITNSRLDYLDEKVKKRTRGNSMSSASVCVVQMNAKFVTKLSVAKHYNPGTESESEDERELANKRAARMFAGKVKHRRKHMYQPYYYPWRSKLEDSVRNIVEAVEAENSSPPVISRQDSGNKSNPSSPVKGQKSSTGIGCSIIRSRSLDDLEISKLDLREDCANEVARTDIETVSQRISKLHVS